MTTATPPQNFAEATDLSGRLIRATNYILDHWWLWLLIGIALWLFVRLKKQHAMVGQLDERCGAAFGDIDALLAERHALIGNIVETVKGFAAMEYGVINDVLDARTRAMASAGQARMEAETQIGQSLTTLFSISDHMPEIASEGHFRDLRRELIRIEERITASRKFYNLAVEEYNAARKAFPANVLSRLSANSVHDKFSLGERRAEFAEPVKISL